ncbi:aldo/keto reductase [Actinomycetospora sp. NBRC 106375]|uniref:aldo/keto reductase n=1 Tax=Actinomycetospora sp. NBRC 106375 TaxID=3032207 RepID=UPI002552AFC6|nr:aldo/keto reductase [Actinomycetospora sp. NBRC 106375]
MATPSLTLNDGTAIPQFGLGVYHVPPEDTAALVAAALATGYRHVDTAQQYGNEAGVGQGLRDAGVPRDDVWITTKLHDAEHSHDAAIAALEASLERLGTDHVDLFLIHRPGPDGPDSDVAAWRAMAALRADGRVRSIGVSNFERRQLDHLVAETGVVPSVHQIRVNPRTPHRALRAHHRRRGIATESWGPLREGRLVDHPVARRVAARVGRTPAQVVLRWHLEQGLIVFPKASSPERLRENLGATEFTLSRRDVLELSAMRRWF